MMKLRFYRIWYNDKNKESTLTRVKAVEPIDDEWERKWQQEWSKAVPDRDLTSSMARENALKRPYSTYLASSLESDFNENHEGQVDDVLLDIEKLERGEIEHCMAGTPDTFMHTIARDKVTFEHSIFGECPEWPLWSCTLAQYKAVLQGYRNFLDMPKSIDSELIVEFPDGSS